MCKAQKQVPLVNDNNDDFHFLYTIVVLIVCVHMLTIHVKIYVGGDTVENESWTRCVVSGPHVLVGSHGQ